MTKYLTTAVAAGALAFGVVQSSAVQATGTVNFGNLGEVVLQPFGSDFATSTGVDFDETGPGLNGANAIVTGVSLGSTFTGTVGNPVKFRDFSYGADPSTDPVWAIYDALTGTTLLYSFDLTTSGKTTSFDAITQTESLTVTGLGTISGPTIENTPGVFTLTASSSSPNQVVFSFQATTTARPEDRGVPDGGATAMLLGLGLIGIGAAAKRRA